MLLQTATKKQKPSSKKKEIGTVNCKEDQTIPDLVHLQPTVAVSGQTKPAEGLTPFSHNKEPLSPIPLVMLLPPPSMPASDSIQDSQQLTSEISKNCLSAPQVIHIPNNCSVGNGSDQTMLLRDMTSPVSGSNVLISLTSVKNEKTGWTLLEGPCTSDSVTKIYPMKQENEQMADIKLKPMLQIIQLNAKNEQKQKLLSNLEILQVLNLVKKNGCGDKRKENLSSSLEKSSDAQLTTNVESDSAVKIQPLCPDFNSAAVMLDSSPTTRQPEEDQIPESLFPSSSKSSSNLDELLSKNNVQKTDKHPQEEDLGLDSSVMELGDEPHIVQCENCGNMVLETDLVQHTEPFSQFCLHNVLGPEFCKLE